MKKADQYLQDRLGISRPEDVTVQSLLEIIPSLECTLHEQDYLSNAWNGDAEKKSHSSNRRFYLTFPIIRFAPCLL